MDEAKVTLEDRKAYLSLNMLPKRFTAAILAGHWDGVSELQAFARHRILVAAEQRGREQERARVVEWLRDAAVRPYCEQADESEFAFCASAIERGDHLPREAIGGDSGHD